MLREQFIGLSLKAMGTLVIRPLQGSGNTAPLSYPDTWVRKPDCVHLPYTCGLSQFPISARFERAPNSIRLIQSQVSA